jgi:hypothetical protein
MVHDDRGSDIGEEGMQRGLSHSQHLAIKISELINSKDDVEYCIDIQKKIYTLKYEFYSQFVQS